MMCCYLNVQFQGQRINIASGIVTLCKWPSGMQVEPKPFHLLLPAVGTCFTLRMYTFNATDKSGTVTRCFAKIRSFARAALTADSCDHHHGCPLDHFRSHCTIF